MPCCIYNHGPKVMTIFHSKKFFGNNFLEFMIFGLTAYRHYDLITVKSSNYHHVQTAHNSVIFMSFCHSQPSPLFSGAIQELTRKFFNNSVR